MRYRADRRRLLLAALVSLACTAFFLPREAAAGHLLPALAWAVILLVALIGLRAWRDGRGFSR